MQMIKPMTARVRYFLVYVIAEEGKEKEHPIFFCGEAEDMERVFGFNFCRLIACDLMPGVVTEMLEKAVKNEKISIGIAGGGGQQQIFSGREEKEKIARCCREVISENGRKTENR